jgi:hypothetical protein
MPGLVWATGRLGRLRGEVIGVAAGSHGELRQPLGSASLPSAVAGEAPEMVAVPAHPGTPGSGELFLEVRQVPGVGRVLPVFSTVGRLVDAMGQLQPWAALRFQRARMMAEEAGVDLVALDPVMSPEAWKWRPQNLSDFEQWRRSHE